MQADTFKVYIEDTDAYAIMYNANYVKFAERAHFVQGNRAAMVVAVDGMKYRRAAKLGEALTVDLADVEAPGDWEGLRAQRAGIAVEGGKPCVTCARLGFWTGGAPGSLPPFEAPAPMPRPAVDVAFRAWPDELRLPPSGESEAVPLSANAVLNLFERARTEGLGGPDALKAFQDDGTTFVISSVSGLRVCGAVRPGDLLRSVARARIEGGPMIVFEQQLVAEDGRVVAHGEVGLVCLSGGKLAAAEKALPPDLFARIS